MRNPWTVHLRLLGMAAVWGASWPWGRMAAQHLPPLTAASVRFLVASLVLMLWVLHRRRLGAVRALSPRQWRGLALAAGFGVFGYSICFMQALSWVPAGKASVVIALNPVATLIAAAWLFGEKVNRWIVLGMVMAVSGALTAISDGDLLGLLAGGAGQGELLLLGCVLCWVGYTLAGRLLLQGIDALVATALSSLIGALMLVAGSLLLEGSAGWAMLPAAPLQVWTALLGMAVCATALGYVWYFDGIKALGAGSAAAYIVLVPVFGVAFSALWLGEAMGLSLLGGAALAVSGLALMHGGRMLAERRAHRSGDSSPS